MDQTRAGENESQWREASAEDVQAAIGVAVADRPMTRAERQEANRRANEERQRLLTASPLARVCAVAPARDVSAITVRPPVRRSVRKRQRASDALADALYSQVQPDDAARVAQVALEQALAGDDKARRWLTDTLIGDYATRQRAQDASAGAQTVNYWQLLVDARDAMPEPLRKQIANQANSAAEATPTPKKRGSRAAE